MTTDIEKLAAITDLNTLLKIVDKLQYLKGKKSLYHNVPIVNIVIEPKDKKLIPNYERAIFNNEWLPLLRLYSGHPMEIVIFVSGDNAVYINSTLLLSIDQEKINVANLLNGL